LTSGRRSDGVLALMVGAAALALYAPRVARDLGWVDSVEFTLAASVLGIPHPTGYPLYVLWTRLAFLLGGVFGVNFLSAIAGAAAVGSVVLVARAIGLGREAAVVAEFVRQATVAEVYTLHLLLVTLVLLAAITAREWPGSRAVLALGYVMGLGLAHHLTMLFVAPAAILLALPALRRGTRPALAALALVLLLPLSLYLVLLLRSRLDPLLDLGDPETLPRLLRHMTGRQFGYRMVPAESGYVAREIAAWGRRIQSEWSPLLLLLAAVGAVGLGRVRDRRPFLIGLLLLGAVTAAHAIAYRIPDKDAYFLPADLALALLAGAGADLVLGLARSGSRGRAGASQRAAVASVLGTVILLTIAVAPAIAHHSLVDRHADRSLRDLANEVIRRAPPGSLVIADDTSLAFALLHLQGEPSGPRDRRVVASYFLPLDWYAARLADLDPELPAKAAEMARSRHGLSGRELGDRLAADARTLAADLARSADRDGRVVSFTFHDYEAEHPTFEGLPLLDFGIVHRLAMGRGATSPIPVLDPEFECLAAYTSGRPLTREERYLSHRLSAAANRHGIARVQAADWAGAEVEFTRAIALDSLYTQAWLNRGLLRADYLQARDPALADWRRYLELAKPGPEADRVRMRVRVLSSIAPLDTTRPHP
jgi:hypothetical protein